MNRKEFWMQVFIEVLRKNGAGGNAQTAITEADLATEALDEIEAEKAA